MKLKYLSSLYLFKKAYENTRREIGVSLVILLFMTIIFAVVIGLPSIVPTMPIRCGMRWGGPSSSMLQQVLLISCLLANINFTSPMRRLCVTKCKESWNKNKTFNISKFDIRVHKIRMFFITKYVITQIFIVDPKTFLYLYNEVIPEHDAETNDFIRKLIAADNLPMWND